MTEQARCEPTEADRGRDGWHWITSGTDEEAECWEWCDGCWIGGLRKPVEWRYLHPVSPHDPADIARLVEAARMAQRNFDPNGYAYGELHTALAAFTAKETT